MHGTGIWKPAFLRAPRDIYLQQAYLANVKVFEDPLTHGPPLVSR